MCDVQLLTGLGILVSAFSQLKHGLSAYHFLITGLLARFAHLNHVAGLSVLRSYLHHRSKEKGIRLLFMFA